MKVINTTKTIKRILNNLKDSEKLLIKGEILLTQLAIKYLEKAQGKHAVQYEYHWESYNQSSNYKIALRRRVKELEALVK